MKRKVVHVILLAIFFFAKVNAQTVSIIPASSAWKYLDDGSNQGTNWILSSFNDASWPTGNAQFGYGDGDEITVVSYGPSATSKYITTYFRKNFNITDPLIYSSLQLNIMRDDGAVIYLNGVEVARSNMPVGTILNSTLATANIFGGGESAYQPFSIPPSSLISGDNIIAVEIHQFKKSNDDVSFNLKLDGTLAAGCDTPTGIQVSSVTSSTAMISCQPVSGAIKYKIRYRPTGTTTYTKITKTSPSWTLTGLTPGISYQLAIQAICTGSTGNFSSSTFFTTLNLTTDTLISAVASWKYLDDGSDQGTNWIAPSFSDNSWQSGIAELGYGDNDEATVVSYGPVVSNKYITTYFRKSFTVNNPSAYTSLLLSVIRDDGIIVYLNGNEVYRNDMPSGNVTYTTLATTEIASTDEYTWYTTHLSPTALVAGTNVLAVEIHQKAANSGDISFKARLWANGDVPVPVVTRGAYLQKVTPNSITIRWRTDIASNSKVNYGTSLQYGSTVSDANLVTEHIVTVNGLNPETKYYYSLGTSANVLQNDSINNFKTAPITGSTGPVRVWVTGDFGNGSNQQMLVRNSFVNYTGSTTPNVWLWVGDNAYTSGLDVEYQSNVFNVYPNQLKNFPLYPAPGNHDYGNVGYQSANALTTNFPYFAAFTVPENAEAGGVASNTPKYYSFNYANIHFISLDSYGAMNAAGSPMYTWLSNDLAANTQRWTIVYFHHPPYTMGSHNSDTEVELVAMRNNIIPLIESYHVDLVLCGHSHINERSYLLKGHFGIENTFNPSMMVSNATNAYVKTAPFDGTIYAVCGTSGQNPGTVQTGYPMPCMYFNNKTNNCSLVIDVAGDNLDCKYLASTGTIVDQFTITKNGLKTSGSIQPKPVEMYYDPLTNFLNLTCYLTTKGFVDVQLFNISGQLVSNSLLQEKIDEEGFQHFEINLASLNLSQGLYITKVTINGKPTFQKLLIGN